MFRVTRRWLVQRRIVEDPEHSDDERAIAAGAVAAMSARIAEFDAPARTRSKTWPAFPRTALGADLPQPKPQRRQADAVRK